MRARRLVATLILLICIGGPIVEMFDRWDNTLEDGKDTEAAMVVAALCVGLGLSVAAAIDSPPRALSALFEPHPSVGARSRRITAFQLTAPIHIASPPEPLRI